MLPTDLPPPVDELPTLRLNSQGRAYLSQALIHRLRLRNTQPTNIISYADAVKAVQAVIDHYDPLPGKLELAYRVIDPPGQHRVFAPSCPRCLQHRDQCICPEPLSDALPPVLTRPREAGQRHTAGPPRPPLPE